MSESLSQQMQPDFVSELLFGPTENGWQRAIHLEEVWGTVVVVEVRDAEIDNNAFIAAVAEVKTFFHQVDDWFSTYRIETPISALRMGFADLNQMPDVVRNVLSMCQEVKALTEGRFDPWAVDGGVDPSGFVKGWAADVAADLLVSHGFTNNMINAAGDVSCRGYQDPDQAWVIGIRHPDDAQAIVHTVEISDAAIATSGEYERGKHIINPMTGDRQMALRSATVVGSDGGVADALATALLIEGVSGLRWFTNLPDWSGFLIEGEQVHFFGPAFPSNSESNEV